MNHLDDAGFPIGGVGNLAHHFSTQNGRLGLTAVTPG